MNFEETLHDIIHHEHGIIFQINQIEESSLILNSMYKEKRKLNEIKYSNFFAFLEKTLIEKSLIALNKIYDQYNNDKKRVRSIKHLIQHIEDSEPSRKMHEFSYFHGKYNKKYLKNLDINSITSTEELTKIIKKENPFADKKLRNRSTNLRNRFLSHNQQQYTVSNDDSLNWNEFEELLIFAKDCIHTISCLFLNQPCYVNEEFIKMYSIEETKYCFENIKQLIKE